MNDEIRRRSVLALTGVVLVPNLGLAAASKPRVIMKTNHGSITVELEAQKAPLTSANFLRYVNRGDYDGGSFYRAARTKGYPGEGQIVGAPNLKSHPFPPILHESTTMTGLKHDTGTISIGRFAPGTATSNFFICASPEPYLDANPAAKGDNLGFAAFGQVIDGIEVVKKILSLPANGKSPFPDQRGQWLDPAVPIYRMRRLA